MTREDAIITLQRFQFGPDPLSAPDLEALNRNCSANLVDAFVALGMLTLDQPPAPEPIASRICAGLGWSKRVLKQAELDKALLSAGLKIVEA